jgi:hypothetical protein
LVFSISVPKTTKCRFPLFEILKKAKIWGPLLSRDSKEMLLFLSNKNIFRMWVAKGLRGQGGRSEMYRKKIIGHKRFGFERDLDLK